MDSTRNALLNLLIAIIYIQAATLGYTLFLSLRVSQLESYFQEPESRAEYRRESVDKRMAEAGWLVGNHGVSLTYRDEEN